MGSSFRGRAEPAGDEAHSIPRQNTLGLADTARSFTPEFLHFVPTP